MILHSVVFDYRIRQKIAAEIVQPRLDVVPIAFNINLKELSDANAADLRHTEVLHRVAHRCSLGVEHSRFWRHDHVDFHEANMRRSPAGTSDNVQVDPTTGSTLEMLFPLKMTPRPQNFSPCRWRAAK